MGGKGGGDDSSQMYQQQPSTIDTNVTPVDLRQDQEFIDVQRRAREGTAPPQQTQNINQQPSLGDVAANTLEVPDFLLGRSNQNRNAIQTTEDVLPTAAGTPRSGSV
jgi:hypothetical protein